jgi:hypothetical protein
MGGNMKKEAGVLELIQVVFMAIITTTVALAILASATISGGCASPSNAGLVINLNDQDEEISDGEVAWDSEEDEAGELVECLGYQKLCDGTCIDSDTDRMNCGGCGIECPETQICGKGVCICPTGFAPCGTKCHDFLSDLEACGGCGQKCFFQNAETICKNGVCEMGECNDDYYDCNDDPSDGCESDLQDLENCGACGVSCGFPNAFTDCLSDGACEIMECYEGFANCDKARANGCEVDLRNDASNCGECGTVCGQNDASLRACVAGNCGCGCGNGICDDELEKIDCPEDCPYTVVCGDGFCDARGGAENHQKCPADCADLPECGVSGCSITLGENHNNCSDCGNVNFVLGDGVCGFRENCQNSPADCGECNSCVFLE